MKNEKRSPDSKFSALSGKRDPIRDREARINALDPVVKLYNEVAPPLEMSVREGSSTGRVTGDSMYKAFLHLQKKSYADAGLPVPLTGREEQALLARQMEKDSGLKFSDKDISEIKQNLRGINQTEYQIFENERAKALKNRDMYEAPTTSPTDKLQIFRESLQGKGKENIA